MGLGLERILTCNHTILLPLTWYRWEGPVTGCPSLPQVSS